MTPGPLRIERRRAVERLSGKVVLITGGAHGIGAEVARQLVVDRLTSTAHELVIEGPSYRRRQKPSIDTAPKTPDHSP